MAVGKELALVHVARKELALSDQEYRAILMEEAGVMSAKALTPWGLEAVMRRFKSLGFVPTARPKAEKKVLLGLGPTDGPTEAQQAKLAALWAEVGIMEPARRQALCRRQTGHPWPQTWKEASTLIDTLRSMAARGWRPRAEAAPRGPRSPRGT